MTRRPSPSSTIADARVQPAGSSPNRPAPAPPRSLIQESESHASFEDSAILWIIVIGMAVVVVGAAFLLTVL
jgi:hypothetical protein